MNPVPSDREIIWIYEGHFRWNLEFMNRKEQNGFHWKLLTLTVRPEKRLRLSVWFEGSDCALTISNYRKFRFFIHLKQDHTIFNLLMIEWSAENASLGYTAECHLMLTNWLGSKVNQKNRNQCRRSNRLLSSSELLIGTQQGTQRLLLKQKLLQIDSEALTLIFLILNFKTLSAPASISSEN